MGLTVFCCIVVRSLKRGFPRKFARFVLFRLIKKRSFNLLCVLDLFSACVAPDHLRRGTGRDENLKSEGGGMVCGCVWVGGGWWRLVDRGYIHAATACSLRFQKTKNETLHAIHILYLTLQEWAYVEMGRNRTLCRRTSRVVFVFRLHKLSELIIAWQEIEEFRMCRLLIYDRWDGLCLWPDAKGRLPANKPFGYSTTCGRRHH